MKDKILIIDDDLETLRLVGLMLQRQGYEIISANNGESGIHLAKKERPNLIVLDVMMPDMDGFSVTKQMRSDPDLVNTPILMFTAKSQVDDKVAGFEAGVDDYLIKPVHPVELVAHIKALLSRRKRDTGQLSNPEKGYVIGVISGKGGLGVSTVALNLGTALFDKTRSEIICAEIIPNKGTWGLELGLADNQSLNKIIQRKADDIDQNLVKQNLVKTTSGINLLLASSTFSSQNLSSAINQIKELIQILAELSRILILDLGSGEPEIIEKIIELCDEIVIVTEAHPTPIGRTKFLLDELEQKGFTKSKQLDILVNNRIRADIQLSITQIQEKLGYSPTIVIPPAPELAYQAVIHFQPLIKMHAESLVTQQYIRFAEHITEKMKNESGKH
ncbi:MAG: response regulator [Anaerolineaceae bacterium]